MSGAIGTRPHDEAVTRWADELGAAAAELEEFEAGGAGAAALAGRGSVDKVADRLRKLRDRRDLAELTLAEARARQHAARIDSWLVAADEWDAEAERRAAAAAAHQQRTADLLEQLCAHDNAVYVVKGGSKGAALARGVEQARLAAEVARAVAAGEDPRPELTRRASPVDGTVLGLPISTYLPADAFASEREPEGPGGPDEVDDADVSDGAA